MEKAFSGFYSPKLYTRLLGQTAAIHPDIKFGENVKLGEGVVIEEGCQIGDNSFIGHYSVLRPRTVIGKYCKIGHLTVFEGDTCIGDRVLIHAQCHITSHTTIEDDVFIGPAFCCVNTRNIKHGRDFELTLKGPTIRRACRIGARSMIMPGLEIGENALIGAGSIVTKDVPAQECWIGCPARFHDNVPPDEIL